MTTPRMPDPPTTESCAPASPIDAAQVLEDAADLMLVRGRCRTRAYGADGSLCVVAALLASTGGLGGAYGAASDALSAHLEQHEHGLNTYSVDWNANTEDDDEVRDTLLLVAKDLRNTAVQS